MVRIADTIILLILISFGFCLYRICSKEFTPKDKIRAEYIIKNLSDKYYYNEEWQNKADLCFSGKGDCNLSYPQ